MLAMCASPPPPALPELVGPPAPAPPGARQDVNPSPGGGWRGPPLRWPDPVLALLVVLALVVSAAAIERPFVPLCTALTPTSVRCTWQDNDVGCISPPSCVAATANLADGYLVERCTAGAVCFHTLPVDGTASHWTVVGATAPTVKTFTDSGLTPGVQVTYRVRRLPYSDTVTITPTTTTTTTTAPGAGVTRYVSPTGNDANAGTMAAPWKTFQHAFPLLAPGYTLIVQDGTYTAATTGLPRITCGTQMPSGTAAAPITVQAQNERQAYLQGDGHDALIMTGCAYWNLVGLRGANVDNASVGSADGNVFRIVTSNHFQLRRLLAVHPNRTCPNPSLGYCNVHAIAIESSHDFLVEESEVYDFHRHGFSVFASRYATLRRCYANPRGAPGFGGGPTGVIFYGTSNGIIENVIAEGTAGLNIAGTTTYDGTPGGYYNRILGSVAFNGAYGSTIRSRNFGGPELPVGNNTVMHTVYAGNVNVGLYSRGAFNTVLDSVTMYQNGADGFAADQDLGEPAPCSGNPNGCSLTARNVLSFGNTGKGGRIDTTVVNPWLVDASDLVTNAGGNYPTAEAIGDASGNIQHSVSTAPGMGLGANQCLLWSPDAGPVHMGARILDRYQDGTLTGTRLWDVTTGAFPCGATVAGVNDVAGSSCGNVHLRLNVNQNGCAFPAGY